MVLPLPLPADGEHGVAVCLILALVEGAGLVYRNSDPVPARPLNPLYAQGVLALHRLRHTPSPAKFHFNYCISLLMSFRDNTFHIAGLDSGVWHGFGLSIWVLFFAARLSYA
jgi:hypothetical protein